MAIFSSLNRQSGVLWKLSSSPSASLFPLLCFSLPPTRPPAPLLSLARGVRRQSSRAELTFQSVSQVLQVPANCTKTSSPSLPNTQPWLAPVRPGPQTSDKLHSSYCSRPASRSLKPEGPHSLWPRTGRFVDVIPRERGPSQFHALITTVTTRPASGALPSPDQREPEASARSFPSLTGFWEEGGLVGT